MMNETTGGQLNALAHLRQSIRRILTTPLGSRVMRRDFGSLLPELIDQPLNPVTRQRVLAATVDALRRWEPRLVIRRVRLQLGDAGQLTVDIEGYRRQLGDSVSMAIPLRGA